ncbi:MAG: beta-lactamase family protein [Chitinophagales bacterium]|nr:beta-lactamase family protein [Chitinophagales bacterium]
MKKILALAAGIIISTGAIAKDKGRELDSIVTHWKNLAKYNGSALVTHHGKELLYKGYGIRAVDYGNIDAKKTLYIIGGATEMFTSTLVFKLQEEGKLSINDTLSKYLPDFPNSKKITLKQLLAHRSGVYDYMNNDSLYLKSVVAPMERKELMGYFKNKPLNFKPGSKTEYSTSDYYLLGMIIEKVTDTTYYAAMRQYILDPLKIENSGFNFGGFASWDKAQGYDILNTSRFIPAFPIDSTISFASAGLFTSAEGINRFFKAMMSNKILKKNSWETMTTDQGDGFAYGWQVKEIDGKKAVGHTGETYGFVSSCFMIPEDTTFIILMNNDFESEVFKIADNLEAALYDQPYSLPERRESVFLEQRRLESYEGRYEFENGQDMNVYTRDKLLWGKMTNGEEFTMLADKKPDEFFMASVDIEFYFIRDRKTNLVTDVIVRQNRKELKGHKWQ